VTYATVQDVAAELGRPISSFTADETAQVNAWLRRAEATIRTRVPDLVTQVGNSTLDVELVASIEAAVVARKVLNPEGKQSEAIDDYTYRRVEAAATVDLAPTDDEWALLIPTVATRGAFTIRPEWG
jgi:hypothetical protein